MDELVRELEARYYFDPLKRRFEDIARQTGFTRALNHITQIMQDCIPEVGRLIQSRIDEGIISDFDQTSKTVAGNGFQGIVAYALVRNQQEGILSRDISVTLKPKKHPLINKYATIKVGNDTQKPDIDLLIYSKTSTLDKPILIYSQNQI